MSYMDYFKFHSQPFSEHAAKDSLWKDARMEEGLSRLQHLVEGGLLGLVTGASGLGKSALLKRFIADQSPQQCETIYCHLTHLPASGLLKLVLGALGEVPKRGKDKLYSQLLDRARASDAKLLLIFDEAHLLSGDALVDLRLLVSSAIEVGPPMKILLVGQDHIRHTLKRSEYTDIVNRISVRYQLKPLTKEQTRRYIDHQVVHHGGDSKIFDDSVKDMIHDFTGGVPRSINNIAITCLLGASSKRTLRIDEDVFQLAATEMHWN